MNANTLRILKNKALNVAHTDNANKRVEKMTSMIEMISGKFNEISGKFNEISWKFNEIQSQVDELKKDTKALKKQNIELKGELNSLKLSLVSRQLAAKVKNNGSSVSGAEKIRNKAGNIIEELHDIAHAKRVKVKNAHELKIKAQRTLAVRESYKDSGLRRPANSFGPLDTNGLRKRAQIINKRLARRPGNSDVELKNYEHMSNKSSTKQRETTPHGASLGVGAKRRATPDRSTGRTKTQRVK